jgi:two-component system, LuxR family, sensor kinase FixL
MESSLPDRQNEKSPAAPERAFESFLEAVPDAMVAVDRRGTIVAVNVQAERLFGYSRGELLGKTMEILVPERIRNVHVRHRDGYMASPHTRPMGAGMDLVGRHKSGAEIPVEISLSPLNAPGGPLVLAAVRDVTDRRQSQEALKVAQAQLELKVAERTSEFLNANKALRREIEERGRLEREILEISEREQHRIGQDLHDNLGQTLTAVTYIAQLLHNKLGQGSVEGKDAAEIGKLVSGAIDQVRGLARGLYPVELRTNGLVPALQELAGAVQSKYRVPCEVRHDGPDPVRDSAAAIQLYRIAQEALTNAAKHANPKRVTVRLKSSGDEVTLAVEDDGVGLPGNFEGGKGMGMHIMRYRADLIGAAFDVRRGEKGGTVVSCVWRAREGAHG